MPLFHIDAGGKVVPFQATPFPDLEKVLEDWIEQNPELLFPNETVAIISRQPKTAFGKYPDLLGIDQSGACVVVELKRGETPREVIAQILEYAAWVDSLTVEQLDDLARAYASRRGVEVTGVADLYQHAFASPDAEDDEEENGPRIADRITFNHRQRLIIVAEHLSGEVEQTLRYLRARAGIDIVGLQIGVHRAAGETIIETATLVGREQPAPRAIATRSTASTTWSDDYLLQNHVQTEFTRHAVTAVRDWLTSVSRLALTLRDGPGSHRYILLGRETQVFFYYAHRWVYCILYEATDQEHLDLQSHLSKPSKVQKSNQGKGVRFHVANEADLKVLQDILQARAMRLAPMESGPL